MGDGARDGATRRWWPKLLVAAVALVAFVVASRAMLDSLARDSAVDVCERSDLDLVRAAGDGDLDAVRDELVEHPVDARDRNANTALGCAIPRRHDEVIRALLDAGADPNRSSGAGAFEDLPVELAWKTRDLPTLAALLDRGADPDRVTADATPILSLAIAARDDPAVDLLLAHGADPNAQQPEPPLVVAVRDGTDASVTALLARGADPNGIADHRPLVAASDADRVDAVAALLGAGADLALPNGTGTTTVGAAALASAAGSGSSRSVGILLGRGVDPDEDVHNGPLLRAITFGHREVAVQLLDAGADPNLGTTDPFTFDVAIRMVAPDLANRLRGADGTAPPGSEVPPPTIDLSQDPATFLTLAMPPLDAAIGVGDLDTARVLLVRGADPNAIAAGRYSPLYLAAVRCDAPAAQLLLDAGADASIAPAGYEPATVACAEVLAILPR